MWRSVVGGWEVSGCFGRGLLGYGADATSRDGVPGSKEGSLRDFENGLLVIFWNSLPSW